MAVAEITHTFDELFKEHPDGKLYELVRGELVEKEMAHLAVGVAKEICFRIRLAIDATREGFVQAELPIKCFPWLGEHGRRPDVCYFKKSTLPDGIPTNDAVTVAPELCVEVMSPNDDALQIEYKIEEYLRAGVQQVWIVVPETKSVRVFHQNGKLEQFRENDTITLTGIIDTFSVRVGEFFPQK